MTDSDVRRLEDKVDGVALALARLEGALTPTLTLLTEGHDDHEERLRRLEEKAQDSALLNATEDHEARLRAVERFRFSIPSVALLSLIASVATLAYYLVANQ